MTAIEVIKLALYVVFLLILAVCLFVAGVLVLGFIIAETIQYARRAA
jgi:hypothetical protein